MIKRFFLASAVFLFAYMALIQGQVFLTQQQKGMRSLLKAPQDPGAGEEFHRVFNFSFSKYTTAGEKEIEIEGDSADVFAKNVFLKNVIAKAYAEESPVTITADLGNIDKETGRVHLEKNVVATTENGTRLLTEALDILPTRKLLETSLEVEVKKDNISIEGLGARGDSRLKKVRFRENVTLVVRNPESESTVPTIITCHGPLIVDYDLNIARFYENVIARDGRGRLRADAMEVYYNKHSQRVSKIVASGNVVVDNPDGNQTYSDTVIYMAEEGKIILGGDVEALYLEGSQSAQDNLLRV